MARQTSKLLQGFSSAGNLYDIKPWVRTIIRANGSGVPDSEAALNAIHGLTFDGEEFNVPSGDVLVTTKTSTTTNANTVLVSADHGFTWREWYINIGTFDDITGMVFAAGLNNFNNGEAIVGLEDSVVGIANLKSIRTAPSISSLLHNTGNGLPTISSGDSAGLRVCLDPVNNYWWIAGQSVGTFRAAWRTAATNITTSGSWNAATGASGSAKHLTFGRSAAGYAVVASVASVGTYLWVNAAAPTDFTVVNLSGSTSMVFRKAVYNKYWDAYLFVDTVRGGTTSAVMRCPYSSIGSATAADYEFITTYNAPESGLQVNSATITVNENGGAGAIGPWCYFQASEGRVLATPDMGDSWYVIGTAALTSNTALLPGFGVTKADGCIAMSYWDNTNERFYSTRTASLATITPFAIR